jgi:hypothetical protein
MSSADLNEHREHGLAVPLALTAATVCSLAFPLVTPLLAVIASISALRCLRVAPRSVLLWVSLAICGMALLASLVIDLSLLGAHVSTHLSSVAG